jgi:hypothetical protein
MIRNKRRQESDDESLGTQSPHANIIITINSYSYYLRALNADALAANTLPPGRTLKKNK